MIIEQEQIFKEVLSKIEGKVNEQVFFNTFLELYLEVWKKHKITQESMLWKSSLLRNARKTSLGPLE